MTHLCLAAALCLGTLGTAADAGPAPRWPLTLTYFGETASHPGLLVGSEHAVWRSGWHGLIASGDLGGNTHPSNHSALLARAGLAYRLSFPSGWSAQATTGLGYLHTWLAGEVYGETSGGVAKLTDFGRPGLMPVISLGLGYDRFFGRLSMFGQYPANQGVLWRPALELGWRFD